MERIKLTEISGAITITDIQEIITPKGNPAYRIEVKEYPNRYMQVKRIGMFLDIYKDFTAGKEVRIDIDETNSQPNGYIRIGC